MKGSIANTVFGGKRKLGSAFVLLFIIGGAVLFGLYGQEVLSDSYNGIANLFKVKAPDNPYSKRSGFLVGIPLSLLGGIAGGFLGGLLITRIEKGLKRWDEMDKGDKVTLFVGFFLGSIVSIPFLQLFQAIDVPGVYRVILTLAVMIGAVASAIYGLQAMNEVFPWNRTKKSTRKTGIKVLDTNVIIAGRLHDVMKTGFLEGQLYVPKFVLEELQYIADSHDALKRQRGRRGLDVLRHMQADYQLQVEIYDKYAPDPNEEVDARLVRLAQAVGGDIVTNDSNLNRVAKLQGVNVLSLNDLAMSLRTNILPEETLTIKIIREGNQFGQGVGYLEDGTMVVIENGQAHVGETADVLVTQVIQTERGKMIFADYDGEGAEVKFEQRKKSSVRRPHQ